MVEHHAGPAGNPGDKATVADLNELPEAAIADLLADCCGSSKWVSAIMRARPFVSRTALMSACEEVWPSLDRDDWLEAFAHHPRIGERTSAIAQGVSGAAWSEREQADFGDNAPHEAMAAANREYEARFGHIYIVCASGRSSDELLSLVRQRLTNDPAAEREVAAEEQKKITRLRLAKLIEQRFTL